jgi:O-antigen/teichoic acid export membrane protein
MFNYSFPLLILGIAGILSQTIDKIIFPIVYPDQDNALDQLGIYGACFKIAVVMVMFTQAFRYAYEPFIFSKSRSSDNRQAYAEAMKYFIIFGLLIFLGVMFYMDILKYFLAPEYWEGLFVVPIIMMAELFFGIYFNLSLWYKLTDKTYWGAVFSTVGCIVIIALNIIFIPKFGYLACAWASFAGFLLIMLLSYFVGQKEYPIKYDLKAIGFYFGFALILYAISLLVHFEHTCIRLGFNTILLVVYISIVLKRDLPLSEIPYLNKLTKK